MKPTLLSLLLTLLLSPALCGQEPPKPILATIPEVQTAEWAKSWWMPRHEEKLEQKKSMGEVDLLMIGDSITHGFEGGGKAMWEKYYAPRKALNLGFSGDRTEQVIWRLQHGAVDGISPKLAVIMIGTNNTGHRQDPAAETALGIKQIIQELQDRLPKTKILLLAVFPRGATADDKLRVLNEEINDRIEKLADDKTIYFLNINDQFLDDDGALPKAIMPDLLHPNAEGYVLWAEAMEPSIAKLMGE